MARHSEDYYWTDEQRTWANNYMKELNEVLSDYESKKRELLEARREYIYKQKNYETNTIQRQSLQQIC